MNGFVSFISALNTEFQKFNFNGKSLQLFIHFAYDSYAIVSEVGLIANLFSISLSPVLVTQKTSGVKPLK